MLFLLLALLAHSVAEAAPNETGIVKPVLTKSAQAADIPMVATLQSTRRQKQVDFLPPAEGLHPKSVVFPGTKGGAWPTHYLYHEPEGCVLPQEPLPNTDGPSKPAEKNATGLNGVFLLLHACAYNSDDWFALPEEVPMVRDLLSRGFLLAVPDAIVQPGGCWSMGLNMESLVHSFGLFRSAFGLEHLPLYAVGSSSGGMMLSGLVAYGVTFAGTMFIVSPGTAGHNEAGTFAQKDHPPSAFVLMPPDTYGVKADIMGAVSALQHNGVPVVTFEVEPKPITALIDRADAMGIEKGVMQKMVSDISNIHFCRLKQPGSFYLIPAYSDIAYMALIRRYPLSPFQTKALWEELKVIEGVHSPTSEHFSESISFLLTARDSTKAVWNERTSAKSRVVTSFLGPVTPNGRF